MLHETEVSASRGNGWRAAEQRQRSNSPGIRPGRVEVERYDGADSVADEWDDLADRVGATPWLRPRWITLWSEAFGGGSLEVFAVRRAGTLAALVPLERRRGALLSPTNWHTPEFGLLAEDGEAARALANAVVSAASHVALRFVNADDSGLGECRAAAARRRVLERTLERSPYVRTEGDWSEYEKAVDGNTVKEVRRRRRRLEEQGALSFEVEDGRDRLDELLAEGFRVEASGWKIESGTAISSQPETERFYTEVARWAAGRGWLRLAFLRLDGHPLAFDFGLEAEGAYYSLKGGFEPAYSKFGPGMLITHDILRHCFAAGVARYEFLGDEEPYKLAWTDDVHDRRSFQAFASSPRGYLAWLAYAHGRPLAKRALALRRR